MNEAPEVTYNTQTYGFDPENTGLVLSWVKNALLSAKAGEEI